MMPRIPSGLARRAGASALCLAVSIALNACERIEQKYGPRQVSVPQPLAEPADAEDRRGDLKPSGSVVVGGPPQRALRGTEILPGRGTAGGEPAGRLPPPGITTDDDGGVQLNFVGADIADVVDLVLGQVLGTTYTIDPRVSGSVTTRSAGTIPRGELFAVLENLLAANGAALVNSGSTVAVVPIEAARRMPQVVVEPGRRPLQRGFGTYFLPVERADAASIQETLQGQISPNSRLVADQARNMLVFSGPAGEAYAVERMVDVLDVDLLSGRSFALVPIQSASPVRVAQEMGQILGDTADGGRGAVLPIERMNAVLAIANSAAQLRSLTDWIGRLDRADTGGAERTLVYYVRSGLAVDLADTLVAVFGSGATVERSDRPGRIAPRLQPVEIGAPAAVSPASFAAPDGTDSGTAHGSGPPGTAEPPLPGAASGFTTPDGLRIVADARRNAIVVRGSEEQLRSVNATIRRLDTDPLQILIEATIAEVLLNDDLQYGLRWEFEEGNLAGIFTNSAAGVVSPAFPGLNLVFDNTDATVVLRALSEITNVEVVSSPQLMVMENETARLQVGDQVPILTQELETAEGGDLTVRNQVAYVDTGVILEVTPTVNADGLVTMQVRQEVSDAVVNQSSQIDSPTIQQRRVNSTLAVRSGQTVALGGLIRAREQDGESGVPLLMDIPVVGNLFKTTSRRGERTELLVLITPRVVRDPLDAERVTQELRSRLTLLEALMPRP